MMALVMAAGLGDVHAQAIPTPEAPSGAGASKALHLPICGANEALATRPDGVFVCKTLPTVPTTLPADCSLGGGADDTTATCVPRGTGQTDPWYTARKDALAKWLDTGTPPHAPAPPAGSPGSPRATGGAAATHAVDCTSFTKVSHDLYRCEVAASKDAAPALPTLKCGAGQTVTFTPQKEVKCVDLPAGRVALPCTDFASGQTSRDGTSIECGPRNRGSVDEAVLARTLDYLYRMVENHPAREVARPVKPSLRTGRIPMCGEGQTLVWREGALFCASQGAAGITRTDATVLRLVIERVIVKLQRTDTLADPFLPGTKLGDTPAVVFLDQKK